VLDMVAAMLTLGQATHQLSHDPLLETGISQMFLAINQQAFGPEAALVEIADAVIASLHRTKPVEEGKPARYPGEQTLRLREENRELGLPVEPEVWAEILGM
jgi:3-dehydro-L-gulonate 2-dehydrogenase